MGKQVKMYLRKNGEQMDIVSASSVSVSDTLTLLASDWVDNTQKVATSVDISKRNVIDVLPQSLKDWGAAGVYASEEASDGITFICSKTPTTDLHFYVTSMVVGQSS